MTLPILVVETAHSRYEIDQNAQRFRRSTVHDRANPIPGFSGGEWHYYTEILAEPKVGGQLRIFMPNGDWLTSTLIGDVTEVPAEVAA